MSIAFKFIILFIINTLISLLLLHLLSGFRLEQAKKIILKNRLYKSLIIKTDYRILESNIQYYWRGYNVTIHYIIAGCLSLSAFLLLIKYPQTYKLVMAGICFSIPWLLLQFVKVKTTALTEQQAITLITSFMTNYGLTQNVFDSFQILEETLSYPLKKPIGVMNKKHFKFKKSGEECLKDFENAFSDYRIRMFARQLSVAYSTGGDVIAMCKNFLADFNRKNRAERNDKIEEFIDRYMFYILIFSTLTLIHRGFMQNNFLEFVTDNIFGKLTLFSTYGMIVWMIIQLIKSS